MSEGQKFTPKSEEEIREQVIQDYELADSDENKSFIDKAVKKELDWQSEKMDSHKKLSQAIAQKKKRDEIIESLKKDDDDDGDTKPKGDDKQNAQIDTSNFVTKEDLKSFNHRNQYSYLKDDEYDAIKAIAGSTGKSFEETMESNPVAKTYLESSKASERISGATRQPSNRTNANNVETEEDKIANELDRDLPVGYSSKK